MADRHHTGPWALPPKPHRARPWADRVRRAFIFAAITGIVTAWLLFALKG